MHTQWESLANEHILGIAPYEPGKPVEELERELGIHDAIKLASNENPLSPSDRVQRAITDALATLNRYPDGSGYYLRHALARKHDVTAEQVVLGNGSNELIELIVRTHSSVCASSSSAASAAAWASAFTLKGCRMRFMSAMASASPIP